MTKNRLVEGLALMLLLISGSAQAYPYYTALDIGALGYEAIDINDRAQVLAAQRQLIDNVYSYSAVILDSDGSVIRDIGIMWRQLPTGPNVFNNSGQVIGTLNGDAALTGPNGEGLFSLGTVPDRDHSRAYAVNNIGQVTGELPDGQDGSSSRRAFITGPDGANMRDFATEAYWLSGVFPRAINDSGQVVGIYDGTGQPFITGPNGVAPRNIGCFEDWAIGWATAVNNSGQVVGYCERDGARHAFITGPDGYGMRDLGNLGPIDAVSRAFDVNERGQVVGSSDIYGTYQPHAFLTGINGGEMIDLNSLVTMTDAVYLSSATDINNRGQILASGSDGHSYLLLLAVPEPASVLLVAIGLVSLLCRKRRIIAAP